MFKKFVQRITEARNRQELLNVFYAEDGIDRAFQKEKLTSKEFEILSDLINQIQRASETGAFSE